MAELPWLGLSTRIEAVSRGACRCGLSTCRDERGRDLSWLVVPY